MATAKVCDVCGKVAKALPFAVTEKAGLQWDACSAECLKAGPPKVEV